MRYLFVVLIFTFFSCSQQKYLEISFDNVKHLSSGAYVWTDNDTIGQVVQVGLDVNQEPVVKISLYRDIFIPIESEFILTANMYGNRSIQIIPSTRKESINFETIQKGQSPLDTIDFSDLNRLTEAEYDSLVKNDSIFQLFDTVYQVLQTVREEKIKRDFEKK
jgi:ABC-type transporter Mla subunit MlaD